MEEAEGPKKSFFGRFWWIFLIVIILVGVWAVMNFIVHPKGSGSDSGEKNTSTITDGTSKLGAYPKCPASLSGILTYQLMDPKYIGSMIPLGNVSPPGHTSPVDHIYFNVNSDDQIPLYAPADGWITHIMANSVKKTATDDYKFDSFVVTYTICDGLVLDFAGYTDVSQSIQDELAKQKGSCKGDITKVGHDDAAEQQCDYQDLNIKVTSGELIGHTHREKTSTGSYNIPFEIWSANYNKPSPSDVDWTYYADDRYAHNVCTFDLYSGDLKNQFDAKFGAYEQKMVKDPVSGKDDRSGPFTFTPRNVQPVCGTLYQNVVGSIQGMWFSGKPDKNGNGSVGATGQGISFIHNNITPTQGEVVVGGEMSNQLTGVLNFVPTHSGATNREPSEIKADGQIYCYSSGVQTNSGQIIADKILVQLIDNTHIKAENQSGSCGSSEAFKTPYTFER